MLLPLMPMLVSSPCNVCRRTKRDGRHAAADLSGNTPANQLLVQVLLTLLLLSKPSHQLELFLLGLHCYDHGSSNCCCCPEMLGVDVFLQPGVCVL
jgi:hypothetical protein